MRRVVLALIAGVFLSTASVVMASPAAAYGGTISGMVSTTDGRAAPDVTVTFLTESYERYGYRWVQRAQTTTDAQGQYVSPVLSPGHYQVRFGSEYPRAYTVSWYGGEAPTVLALADTDALKNIDGVVKERASISGTVTGAGGEPVPGGHFELRKYNPDTKTWGWGSADHAPIGEDGRYRMRGLDAGTYRLLLRYYDGVHASQWWGNASTLAQATDIVVSDGEAITGKDFRLQKLVKVSGTVSGVPYETEWGTSTAEVIACPYSLSETQCQESTHRGGTHVGEGGTYELAVPPGDYRVAFRPYESTRATQWWDGTQVRAEAKQLTVTAGEPRTGIDGEIVPSGTVSAQVVNANGDPANGLEVVLLRRDLDTDTWVQAEYSSTRYGAFAIPVREQGEYKLKLTDHLNRYATHWYRTGNTLKSADSFAAGLEDVDLGTIVVGPRPTISGTVTNKAGEGVAAYVQVCGRNWAEQWDCPHSTRADDQGRYSVTVDSGSYKLSFHGPDSTATAPAYVSEYHGGLPTDDPTSMERSPAVEVGPAGSAEVNAELATYGRVNCQISTTRGGVLPMNTALEAFEYDAQTGTWGPAQRVVYVNSYGSCNSGYGLPRLEPGTYRFRASPYNEANVEPRWSGNATSLETATDVVVPDGGTVDVQIQMPKVGPPETTIDQGPREGSVHLPRVVNLAYSSQELGTTFECRLDGQVMDCPETSVELGDLSAGAHVFEVAAVGADGETDATPAVRSWVTPIDNSELTHGKGWTRKNGAGFYLDTYSQAKTKGATLTTVASEVSEIALIVPRAPGLGTVKVYLGKRMLATMVLHNRKARPSTVVPLVTLPSPGSGKLRLVVATSGAKVHVDGVVLR